jgi:hypothetical protein
MHVWSRQIRMLGGAAAAGWAMDVTEKANAVTGMPASLWMGTVGLPAGSYAWTAPVEGMAQIAEANQKMMGDAAVTEAITKGREFIVEVMPDRLAQLIHGEITEPAEVGTFLGTVSAVAAEGQGVAAGAWAVKIADIYSEITGLGVLVTATVAGPMFEYTWGVRHASAASVDEATAKVMASDSYAAELDNAGGLFHPGTAQIYAQRIA